MRLPDDCRKECICLLLFAVCAIESSNGQLHGTAKENSNHPGQYQVITEGLVASPPVSFQFKGAGLRVEIRNFVMGRRSTQTPPMPTRAILEVRGGSLLATVNGVKTTYVPGDFFVVEKGAVLEMENPGDVTVLRAMYIFQTRK